MTMDGKAHIIKSNPQVVKSTNTKYAEKCNAGEKHRMEFCLRIIAKNQHKAEQKLDREKRIVQMELQQIQKTQQDAKVLEPFRRLRREHVREWLEYMVDLQIKAIVEMGRRDKEERDEAYSEVKPFKGFQRKISPFKERHREKIIQNMKKRFCFEDLKKKKSLSATTMRLLKNPAADRQNKVAENKLTYNMHELNLEYAKFSANHCRTKMMLQKELRDLREQMEQQSHDTYECVRTTPISWSPRPSSRMTHERTTLPEGPIEEADEEKEEKRSGRKFIPGSTHDERMSEQRMNNVHKRFSIQANSRSSIQDIQRKQQMSAKGKRASVS